MSTLVFRRLDLFLNALSGESSVMVQELASNEELLAMIKSGSSYEELLNWIKENY